MTSKVLIIAEAGVNHDGDLDKAFALVDAASTARADIVKFQSFSADKLVSKNAPKAQYQIENTGNEESQYEMLKRLELSKDDHVKLIAHCKSKNIEFLSTPFDIGGLHMLINDFNLSTIKLGSSELTNAPILLAAAQTGRKIILSTGMGTLDEIEDALGVLAYGYSNARPPETRNDFIAAYQNPHAKTILKDKVTILHCTTAYPTPYEDVNLHAMMGIHDAFDIPVGYSDHTLGIEVSLAAAAMGATVIEKHFTLDKAAEGPDHKASLEPDELNALVQGIRNIESAMGSKEKRPSESEKINITMARKSLVAARDIRKGEELTSDNLDIKRPATGISPMEYWDRVGTIASKDYTQEEIIEE